MAPGGTDHGADRHGMILPKVRDPRFITVRRGGTLEDDDHHLLALWAADCATTCWFVFDC